MKALVTGITGQDASFLSDFLLSKGYEVYGLMRKTAIDSTLNIKSLLKRDKFHLVFGDMENEIHLTKIVSDLKPDEIYNLAAQSDVAASFEIPEYTGEVTGLGVTRLLEAVRYYSSKSKVYQASTSEMFGNAPPPQSEITPLTARSPYAAAKIYAHEMMKVYRESYGIFGCCGILFNHESEHRGLNFVTRKITNAVARISLGKQDKLELGNLDSKRDWGYAPDYIKAMWLMLQQENPDDYVIGTGETHTVQEFVNEAFGCVRLDPAKYVVINPKFVRPSEVNYLQADATKARGKLGWTPKIKFKELVRIMVAHDLEVERASKI